MKLVARNLSFSYEFGGKPALSKLDFTAEPGSYWCIAGPNGSGKSTFLKLACGLVHAGSISGELTWNDTPVVQWGRVDLARNIAFVPGSLKTQFPVTVEEFVLQGRYAHSAFWSQPSADDRNITRDAMERAGIASHAQSRINQISAGETQLAMIARALAQQPKVLVLDEATANLDLRFQARILELLDSLHQQGMTVLLVSHDLNLAAEFCPNVFWLKDGTAFNLGTMAETLTTDLMRDLYGVDDRIEVGKNPFTSRPKIFWNKI